MIIRLHLYKYCARNLLTLDQANVRSVGVGRFAGHRPQNARPLPASRSPVLWTSCRSPVSKAADYYLIIHSVAVS